MGNEVSTIPRLSSLRLFSARVLELSVVISRLVIAAVFVYAGLLKAIHPGQLIIDIQHYQLVSDRVAWLAAGYLPYIEIFAALALVIPKTEEAAQMILGGLLLVFIGALISAWIRGLNIACGCFGHASSEKTNYVWWLTRDLGLLIWLLFTAVAKSEKRHR